MASRGRPLSQLARLVAAPAPDSDVDVVDVTHDSRMAVEGSLYVALRGANADGHDFVPSAVANGAVAICVDHPLGSAVPELVVHDTRSVLGVLAASVHGDPSADMSVIGVTGTNGKTTVTHFVDSIARHAGMTTGLVGTIHTRIAGESVPARMTTPEASEFQRLLATMRDNGVTLASVEVSSHALEFGRVSATRFAVAAFTNLSQDHLDFHGDMASYGEAKRRLFTEYEVGLSVFNIDDPFGADLAGSHAGEKLTVGSGGDISLHHVDSDEAGHTRLHLETPWGGTRSSVPVVGEFNLANVSVAAACALGAGIRFDVVAAALPQLEGVPGRFEVVSGSDPITVVVDYAHTPEAVARAIEAGSQIGSGRVVVLLGAGGDRDRAKRPAMGSALSTADLAVVTSDNPRSEDPDGIVAAVVAGMDRDRPHLIEADRHRAIDLAIDSARDGDVVLILGRGHEPFQSVAGEQIPFDDRQVAAAALQRRRKSADSGGQSGSMSQ